MLDHVAGVRDTSMLYTAGDWYRIGKIPLGKSLVIECVLYYLILHKVSQADFGKSGLRAMEILNPVRK